MCADSSFTYKTWFILTVLVSGQSYRSSRNDTESKKFSWNIWINSTVLIVFKISQHLSKLKIFWFQQRTLRMLNARSQFFFVEPDIVIQSSHPNPPPLLHDVQKADQYMNFVLTTTVVKKNINFRHIIVLIVWLRIVSLVIDPTKEASGNFVHPLLSFKLTPSINRTYVIWSIMNTQAIKIGRLQVISRYGLFTFESWQNDILAHVHGHCNIRCDGAWFFFLCMILFIFASFLQIFSLDSLQIWWKDVVLCFFVLYTLHLQFDICDDIWVVFISINSIIVIVIIIINKTIRLFIWLFLKTLVITKNM